MKLRLFSSIFMIKLLLLQPLQGCITWLTDYSQAQKQALLESKPLLLFFTESEECGWCKKLMVDTLDTESFVKVAGDKFVFVLIDSSSAPKSADFGNEQLKKQFHVRGSPTLIILDSNENQIGITGYRSGGGKEYATHLLKMVEDYLSFKQKIGAIDQKKLSCAELKELYMKAKEFHCDDDLVTLITLGTTSDDSSYFMLESMRLLAAKNKLDSQEASDLRRELMQKDPENAYLTHYHLAVIDFEKRYKEMKQHRRTLKSTLDPLTSYIKRFGDEDRENSWRINMIISQMLFDSMDYRDSLKYAKRSYDTAPSTFQPDIAEMINDILEQIDLAQNPSNF